MSGNKTVSWGVIAAMTASAAALGFWLASPQSSAGSASSSDSAVASPPADVVLATATQAEIAPIQWGPGDVVSHEDARVAAEVGGRVERIAEIGTEVRKGEIVAWLDQTTSALKVRELRATLDRIDAQLAYSRKQEARYEALQEAQAVSASFRDQVRSEREIRQYERAIALAALDEAKNRVDHAAIRAPFDGVVAERLIVAGEYIEVGEPVVRLVNTRRLEIRARAPIALARRLDGRSRVMVRDGDTTSEQALLSVIPVGDSPSRQLELRVALSGLSLPIGSAVDVGVPDGDTGPAVTVPRDAVILRREGAHVMRVNAKNIVERVPVKTGAAAGDRVAVIGNLRAGDRVVIRGGERIQPGQSVRGTAR